MAQVEEPGQRGREAGDRGGLELGISDLPSPSQVEPSARVSFNVTAVASTLVQDPGTVLGLGVGQMVEKFASPQVFIRRYKASEICDVVVSVRGQEIVLRCPNYSQALKWARLECKSYKIPQPDIEPLSGPDHDELPLFLRSPEKTE